MKIFKRTTALIVCLCMCLTIMVVPTVVNAAEYTPIYMETPYRTKDSISVPAHSGSTVASALWTFPDGEVTFTVAFEGTYIIPSDAPVGETGRMGFYHTGKKERVKFGFEVDESGKVIFKAIIDEKSSSGTSVAKTYKSENKYAKGEAIKLRTEIDTVNGAYKFIINDADTMHGNFNNDSLSYVMLVRYAVTNSSQNVSFTATDMKLNKLLEKKQVVTAKAVNSLNAEYELTKDAVSPDEGIPANLKSFVLEYEPAIGTNMTYTLKDSQGKAIALTKTETGKAVTLSLPENTILPNETYTLTVTGYEDAVNGDYGVSSAYKFSINDTRGIILTDVWLEDSEGNKVESADLQVTTAVFPAFSGVSRNGEKVYAHIQAIADGVVKGYKSTELSPANDQIKNYKGDSIAVEPAENLGIYMWLSNADGSPLTARTGISGAITPDENWVFSYTGTEAEKANKKAYAEVVAPDGTTVVYRTVVELDAGGNYTVEFKFESGAENIDNALSGEYTINLVFEDGTSSQTPGKQVFKNVEEEAARLQEIKDTVTGNPETKDTEINTIKTKLDDYGYALGLTSEKLDFYTTDLNLGIATILYNESVAPSYVQSRARTASVLTPELVQAATVITGIAAGDITNLFVYETELGLSSRAIADFYIADAVNNKNTNVNDTLKTTATTNVKAKAPTSGYFESFGQFYDNLYEQYFLTYVANSDGMGNAKRIIQAFAENGLLSTGATGTDDAYSAVADQTFASYELLEAAFNAANVTTPPANPSPGPGGGGGGGGVSKPSKEQMTPVFGTGDTDATDAETIPMNIFSDIEAYEWAMDAIVFLAERQIVNGKGEGKFCPGDRVTREELAKMVVAAFAKDVEPKANNFADVPKDKWSYGYVAKAYAAGIINGYSDAVFGAEDLVTRQDVAVMLHRAGQLYGIEFNDTETIFFNDESEFSDYAAASIKALAETGFVNGVGENIFAPKAFATRAEIAKIIYGLLNQ